MKTYNKRVPILKCGLVISFDEARALKELNIEPDHRGSSVTNAYVVLNEDAYAAAVIFREGGYSVGVAAHEAVHLVMAFLRMAGDPARVEEGVNEETFAYLLEYVITEIEQEHTRWLKKTKGAGSSKRSGKSTRSRSKTRRSRELRT